MRIFLTILIFVQGVSCSKGQTDYKPNPKAVEQNLVALEYLIKSEYDTAIFIFDKAIAIDSLFDLPHRNKFRIYFKLKDFKNALIECEALTKLYPTTADLWVMGGMIHERLGNKELARDHYLKGLELLEMDIKRETINSYKGVLLCTKGITLILLDEEDEGRNIIKELIIANPDDDRIKRFSNITKSEYLENVFEKQIYFNEENDYK